MLEITVFSTGCVGLAFIWECLNSRDQSIKTLWVWWNAGTNVTLKHSFGLADFIIFWSLSKMLINRFIYLFYQLYLAYSFLAKELSKHCMQLHHIKQILPLKLILKLVSDALIRIKVIDHLTNLRYTCNVLYIS